MEKKDDIYGWRNITFCPLVATIEDVVSVYKDLTGKDISGYVFNSPEFKEAFSFVIDVFDPEFTDLTIGQLEEMDEQKYEQYATDK